MIPDEFVDIFGYFDQIVAAHVQILKSSDRQQLFGEVRQPVTAYIEHLEVCGTTELFREPIIINQIILGDQRGKR